jgi:DNA/RNA-binding domain of Phe-tRNA-synthetase-like protein
VLAPLRFVLDPSLANRVMAWSVEVADLVVEDSPGAYEGLVRAARRQHELHSGRSPGQIPGTGEARRLYKSFGVDPTRTRPSSEALLRRALKRQEFYRISNVVDVGNWVSLEFLLPLGLYDRDKIDGEVATVRVGEEGEEYEGIRKGPVHVGGRLCVADQQGAFGSPTSDSLRTSVDPSTRRVAAIVFGPGDVDADRVRDAGVALAARLVEHGGGKSVDSRRVEVS